MAEMLMGAFEDRERADRALAELENQGYTPEEISVISSNKDYEGKGYTSDKEVDSAVGKGAVTGGVIGGLTGLLAGAGVVPALAGLVIGGPIVGALGLGAIAATAAAGALTGAAAGGLIGALTAAGVSPETATAYDEVVQKGGVVVGLTGDDQTTAEARAIMEKHGARDVSIIDMKSEAATDERESARSDKQPEEGYRTNRQPAFGERRDTRDTRDNTNDI